jgi:F-type H+-transporting ATPase subunit epsilon
VAQHPKFSLSLVTPAGPAFEGEAEMVIVPGDAGEIGVLARHAPLVALLKAGSTRVYMDTDSPDEVRTFATGPGFFQVLEDRAIALVDDAVLAGDIDDARASRRATRPPTAGSSSSASATPRTSSASAAAPPETPRARRYSRGAGCSWRFMPARMPGNSATSSNQVAGHVPPSSFRLNIFGTASGAYGSDTIGP